MNEMMERSRQFFRSVKKDGIYVKVDPVMYEHDPRFAIIQTEMKHLIEAYNDLEFKNIELERRIVKIKQHAKKKYNYDERDE